jgi:CHRD domain
MSTAQQFTKQLLVSIAAAFIAGNAGSAFSGEVRVLLAGNQEVPQVTTPASGSGTFTVGDDGSISGSVSTLSIAGTAAHIHEGAPSANGPVIVPLTKTSATVWSVPAGSKLTEAQMQSYKAGQLYVNVHSAANKGGEIRGQLEPK